MCNLLTSTLLLLAAVQLIPFCCIRYTLSKHWELQSCEILCISLRFCACSDYARLFFIVLSGFIVLSVLCVTFLIPQSPWHFMVWCVCVAHCACVCVFVCHAHVGVCSACMCVCVYFHSSYGYLESLLFELFSYFWHRNDHVGIRKWRKRAAL